MAKLAVCVGLALLAMAFAMPIPMSRDDLTALDEYVNKPDSTYKWEDTGIVLDLPVKQLGIAKGHVLNMTSQTWLSTADVDCSVWWHYVVVIVPEHIKIYDKPLLWITGGDNDNAPPAKIGDLGDGAIAAEVAMTTGAITATILQIPNQPCHFVNEEGHPRRKEDSLIAYTWRHFLDNPSEPEWLLRLPMTKAIVRAMDTVEAYVQQKFQKPTAGFVISGASKRGWTTWTTGAVCGSRCLAIAPVVMDALNFKINVHHMWRAYGGWTFAFKDYWNLNLTKDFDSPNLQKMADIVDPFSYKDRLTMPKLIVSTSDDEFFLPDDSHYYYDQMKGDKHMLILRNAEHSCATGVPELLPAYGAWYLSVVNGDSRPTFTQSIDNTTGAITVVSSEKPTHVKVRYAHTPKGSPRRDFRWLRADINCTTKVLGGACLQPILWLGKTVHGHKKDAGYTYTAEMPAPKDGGWAAFFIEMHYKGPHIAGYTFTSQVSIVPNVFPYPECYADSCYGELL